MSTARIKEKMSVDDRKLEQLLNEIKTELGVEFTRDESKAIDGLIKRKTLKHYEPIDGDLQETKEPVKGVKK